MPHFFALISSFFLYGLTLLCFFIPFSCGRKETGKSVGIFLGVIITLILITDIGVFVIVVFPLIVIFQLIFITYWIFVKFKKEKAGKITALILTSIFVLFLMQPWISDWIFSKNDARKILLLSNIELKDDFKILRNERPSWFEIDYPSETFSLKISDTDFKRISEQIKTSKKFKGFFAKNVEYPSIDYKNHDTLVDFENEISFVRQCFPSQKTENGISAFNFHLNKKDKTLYYWGRGN